MPLKSGGVLEVDEDFEFNFGPYDGDGPKMYVFLDLALWRTLMFKKDSNPELLRWFLLLPLFEFEVHDKG